MKSSGSKWLRVFTIIANEIVKEYDRFLKGLVIFRRTKHPNIFHVSPQELDEYFPASWGGSSAPVIFDFKGYGSIDDSEKIKTYLYCLLPKKLDGSCLLLLLSRQYFIDKTTSGDWLSIMESFRRPIQKQNQQQQKSNAWRILGWEEDLNMYSTKDDI